MGYTMNIVGEQFFQSAIVAADEGDPVVVAHEVGNPRDAEALVVKHGLSGRTLGYLPIDSFVHRIAFQEGGSVDAEIARIYDVGGVLQMKIYVMIDPRRPVARVPYSVEAAMLHGQAIDAPTMLNVTPALPPSPPQLSDFRMTAPAEEPAPSKPDWLYYAIPGVVLFVLAVGLFS